MKVYTCFVFHLLEEKIKVFEAKKKKVTKIMILTFCMCNR